ncbi:MAG: single-stranded DNA-binding protein [Propionicimonas sp.]|nr:single-stranded DNA-binding protein [Propionicimonas sp.]
MTDPSITLAGNAVADPELRHDPDGNPQATLTVACNHSEYDKTTGQWVQGDTAFMKVVATKRLAENVAASITKGNRVVVTGKLRSRSYQGRDGNKKTVQEVHADEVAASMLLTTVTVNQTNRNTPPEPRESTQTATGTSSHRQTPNWAQTRPKPFGKPAKPTGDPWAQPGTLMDEPSF